MNHINHEVFTNHQFTQNTFLRFFKNRIIKFYYFEVCIQNNVMNEFHYGIFIYVFCSNLSPCLIKYCRSVDRE